MTRKLKQEIDKEIGKRIEELRLDFYLSRRELAKRVGITDNYLGKLERYSMIIHRVSLPKFKHYHDNPRLDK